MLGDYSSIGCDSSGTKILAVMNYDERFLLLLRFRHGLSIREAGDIMCMSLSFGQRTIQKAMSRVQFHNLLLAPINKYGLEVERLCKEKRELLIRTSFEWRVQRFREELGLFCWVFKNTLTRRKPFVWDEKSINSVEEPDEEDPFAFTGPDFNPAITALFSTDYAQSSAPYQPTPYPNDASKG